MIKNNQTYYYHADGLGSIIAITDSFGRVVQRYEYDSFGNITYQQDPNFIQPYTYTGREWDEESGLYYYRARYYDAKVGRFLQQDTFRGFLSYPQTQNRYPYVENNPINLKDPLGLSAAIAIPCLANPYCGGALLIGGILYYGFKNLPPPPKPPDDNDTCDPTRPRRCYEALLGCFRYANGDREIGNLCMKAHTTCVTTNLPVIFPHGVWVD